MSIGRKQEKLEDNGEEENNTEMEAKDKNGSKTLPKPRGWMYQGLDGSENHLMDLYAPK